MQINLQTNASVNMIRGARETANGYEIQVAEQTLSSSAILTPDSLRMWEVRGFESLRESDFEVLAELDAEVVVLGTGSVLRFPNPALTRSLNERQIGLEVMDTPAACRTYNILASDGRRVVAALILGDAQENSAPS